MAKYLVDNDLLIGKTKDEVIEMLGQSKGSASDRRYRLGGKSPFALTTYYLIFNE